MMNVMLNFAISEDGKIGTSSGGASKFTSRRDLERLWEIRMRADAILVGRGTLEADNMSMTLPAELKPKSQPLRLIASRKGRFNYNHPVFQKEGGHIHLLSTEQSIISPPDAVTTHQMSLACFLEYCENELGVKTLLCEGGGDLVCSLAELNRIDEIHLTIAGHTIIGGKLAPGILGTIKGYLPSSQRFNLTHFEPLENGECFLSYAK